MQKGYLRGKGFCFLILGQKWSQTQLEVHITQFYNDK
jgi:hypothetical protein